MPSCPPPQKTQTPALYCKPYVCRSEPLSHSEYLRMLVKNGGQSLGSASPLQTGHGDYKKTIWTTANNSQCAANLAVPAVHPGGHAKDNGFLTEAKGAMAGRGRLSRYDTMNRNAGQTILRNKGNAIAADNNCSNCDISGTVSISPVCPDSIRLFTN